MSDTIEFGRYRGKPLQWDILYEDSYKQLLFCITAVRRERPFNGSTWEDHYCHKWLNEEFLKEAFSNKELKQIVNTRYTDGEAIIKDNVFLLSKAQCRSHLKKEHFDKRNYILTRSHDDSHQYFYFSSSGLRTAYSYDNFDYYPAIYLKKPVPTYDPNTRLIQSLKELYEHSRR